MRRNTKTNRLRTHATRRAAIDALEPRRMLAVFNGTSGNDKIDIFNWAGGGMAVRFNDGVINTTIDPSITINAGIGHDTFNVSSSRSGTTIVARGDSGNDTLVNPSVEDLDGVYVADFTFEGGTGTDTVIANNAEDTTTPYQMTLTGFQISKSGVNVLLEYSGVESLEYWDSHGSNLIEFEDMAAPVTDVALEIHGNAGIDTIYNASDTGSSNGEWVRDIGTGGVFIEGGTGADTLLLSNANAVTDTFTFNFNAIIGSDGVNSHGTLIYDSNIERIDFVASHANDSVNLASKLSGTSLLFNGGLGHDDCRIGGGDLDDQGWLVSNTTILGGDGTDSITTEDAGDTNEAGENEIYSWGVTVLQKGTSPGFIFNEFERQTLLVANGSGSVNLPIVNINNIASTITSTTVAGGSTRMCKVNVGSGNLNNINGTLFLNLSGGPLDHVSINNTIPTANTLYRLTQTQLAAPKVINYSGVKDFTINAGSADDTFFIDGLRAGTALTLNENAGFGTFHLGGGDVDANVLGPVTCNGGADPNRVIVDNTSDASLATQTLNGATFIDGQSHTFSSLVNLTINSGPGGTNLAVNATSFQTELNGGSGNDTYIVGGGDIDANLAPTAALALAIDGHGGTDSIRFDDRNDTNLNGFINFQRQFVVDQLFIDDTNDYFVNWLGIESATFDASNAEFPGSGNSHSFIVVTDCGTPLTINGNGGPDSIAVNDAFFPVIVNSGPGEGDSFYSNADLDANPGIMVLQESDAVRDLGVFSSGEFRVTNGAVLNKTGTLAGNLTIDGVLDLAGGALLSSASGTPLDFFRTRLARGYNGGAWNGTHASGAINSSLAASSSLPDAAGYGLGSEIGISTIGGFNIAAGDTLVRYTYYGDADLNGKVDGADYARIDSKFNQQVTQGNIGGWVNGDFDYNNKIDGADYALIDAAFNSQGATLGPAFSPLARSLAAPRVHDAKV